MFDLYTWKPFIKKMSPESSMYSNSHPIISRRMNVTDKSSGYTRMSTQIEWEWKNVHTRRSTQVLVT